MSHHQQYGNNKSFSRGANVVKAIDGIMRTTMQGAPTEHMSTIKPWELQKSTDLLIKAYFFQVTRYLPKFSFIMV